MDATCLTRSVVTLILVRSPSELYVLAQAGYKGSPSPSQLRWVGFPVKKSKTIKAVHMFADDRSPIIIPATCGSSSIIH